MAQARRDVRRRDLGPRDPHADAGTRSARHQAALLHAAGRRPRVRLGDPRAQGPPRASVRRRRARGPRLLQFRPRAEAALDLPAGAKPRTGTRPSPRADGRGGPPRVLATALPDPRRRGGERLDRGDARARAADRQATHAGGRAGRRVPVGRRGLRRRDGRDDASHEPPDQGVHDRISEFRHRRDRGGAALRRAPRLRAHRAADAADGPGGDLPRRAALVRRAVRGHRGGADLVPVAARRAAREGGAVRRRRRRALRRLQAPAHRAADAALAPADPGAGTGGQDHRPPAALVVAELELPAAERDALSRRGAARQRLPALLRRHADHVARAPRAHLQSRVLATAGRTRQATRSSKPNTSTRRSCARFLRCSSSCSRTSPCTCRARSSIGSIAPAWRTRSKLACRFFRIASSTGASRCRST